MENANINISKIVYVSRFLLIFELVQKKIDLIKSRF